MYIFIQTNFYPEYHLQKFAKTVQRKFFYDFCENERLKDQNCQSQSEEDGIRNLPNYAIQNVFKIHHVFTHEGALLSYPPVDSKGVGMLRLLLFEYNLGFKYFLSVKEFWRDEMHLQTINLLILSLFECVQCLESEN